MNTALVLARVCSITEDGKYQRGTSSVLFRVEVSARHIFSITEGGQY